MKETQEKIKVLKKQLKGLYDTLEEQKARKKFSCYCGKRHSIKDCDVVQTYWMDYDGDAHYGELQIICPVEGGRNRVMFDNFDIPYQKRREYECNLSAQFEQEYKHLFKSVVEENRDKTNSNWYNNYYFDKNHKRFGLSVKED